MVIIDTGSHRIVREKIVAIRPKYDEKPFHGQWKTVVICEGNVEFGVDCETDRLQAAMQAFPDGNGRVLLGSKQVEELLMLLKMIPWIDAEGITQWPQAQQQEG